MTEKIDSLAFFDQLAATSQSHTEHEIEQFSNLLNTIKPSKKQQQQQQAIVQEDFDKKWKDFTSAYKFEKQALCEHMKERLMELEKLEQRFQNENIDLHTRITTAFYDISQNIQQHKENLNSEKKQYDNEINLIKEIRKFQDEKIKLNVGGQLFETSLTTLRKDPNSMLADMFREDKQIQPDADNSYFIDRDGTYFRLVLNYLRDLRIPSGLAEDPKIMDELMQEAQYYKLNDLLKIKWIDLPEVTQEELSAFYPISSDPVLFTLEKKDLSNLDFSGYIIDPRSSFMGSNLENSQFHDAKFNVDLDNKVNFSSTFLVGATFPKEELQLRLEGAILSDELRTIASPKTIERVRTEQSTGVWPISTNREAQKST